MNRGCISTELILLPSLKAQLGPKGSLVLTEKYLNGAAEFAKTWPGVVTSLVELRQSKTTDMDHVGVRPEESKTGLEIRPNEKDALAKRLESASCVLAFLSPLELATAKLCNSIGVPIVFTSEYTVSTEKQIIDSETNSRLLRLRRKMWVNGAEKKRRTALGSAAGIQCSGTPTYKVYNKLHDNALLFFDNRVSEQEIIDATELEQKLKVMEHRKELKLVFGGRLIAMKGVMYLPEVARILQAKNVEFTLDIYGSGPLEGELAGKIREYRLDDKVKLRGVKDFKTEWIPLLKQEADIFLCCHTQGDPSSIYPEVMSCGVPIVGFANEAFQGVVEESGSGWLGDLFKAGDLADILEKLYNNRGAISKFARQAKIFARESAFEKTFHARAQHLVNAAFPEK